VKLKVGEVCKKNQLLGVVMDLLGNVVEEVKAPLMELSILQFIR